MSTTQELFIWNKRKRQYILWGKVPIDDLAAIHRGNRFNLISKKGNIRRFKVDSVSHNITVNTNNSVYSDTKHHYWARIQISKSD